ncbi:MAG: helix-turn-helix domain-containing protein [Xanthobacteraceae bacterium]
MEDNLSTIADEESVRVGQAIKIRRQQLGLTLRALALKSGVSSSMISDIERGTKSPTISIISAIAQALGLPLSALVDRAAHPTGRFHVVRASERPEFIDPTSGAKRKSFSPALARSKVEFLRYVVPPHTLAGPFQSHASGTIEHMHLAVGSIRAVFGTDVVKLETGDSCTCLADTPHHFDNRESEGEALIYIVVERP